MTTTPVQRMTPGARLLAYLGHTEKARTNRPVPKVTPTPEPELHTPERLPGQPEFGVWAHPMSCRKSCCR